LLERYGYPQVLERFRFHMTLSGPLPRTAAEPILALARDWAGRLQQAEALVLDRLSLFVEPSQGAPFERRADFLLQGVADPDREPSGMARRQAPGDLWIGSTQ
jgi:hypothetical protein